ncbi:MAG: phosphatase PAP2 family protein [Gemmatimonadetes bacterium]|nr:phosphatase PAP2 family protein [Gemmatimonadota bacterium]
MDRLLLAYVGFVTAVILFRGAILESGTVWLLIMHAWFAALLFLCTGPGRRRRFGRLVHDLYPLIMLLPFYGAFGVLNAQVGWERVLANDRVVQAWEAGLFGSQVSYQWIRRSPSVFWSALLHLAYFAYYAVVVLTPLVLALRGQPDGARRVIYTTMVAFVICYVAFVLFPVAGPNYAFPHPTGPVREVWSARLVYGVLAQGSSFGASFPSSHVAAAVAATLAALTHWRPLGWTCAVLTGLMAVGTVYCQMHYVIDATAGLIAGVLAWAFARTRAPVNPEMRPALSGTRCAG